MIKYLALVMLFLNISQAGMFSTISGMAMQEVKPDHSYTIDTAGLNPRVYEFTPKANPNKICVVVFGNSKSGISIPAMQCFDKKIQDR
jgi:hypothetical protein